MSPPARRQAVVVGLASLAGLILGLLLIGLAQGRILRPAAAATGGGGAAIAIGAQPVAVTAIEMFTPTIGWALGQRADRPDQQILRTVDSGQHWTDVTPLRARNARYVPAFLGSDHAWVLVNGELRSNTVYRSSDAGLTWLPGDTFTVLADFGVYGPVGRQPLQFVDPLHGYITFIFGNGEGISVYGTSDGGVHWQLRSATSSRPGLSTPGSLPTGCMKTGTAFSSATTGWATAHCPGGKPFFYASHDGGRSWQVQVLPSPLGYPADLVTNCQCLSIPPAFTSPRDGVLTFARPDFVYSTHDGGATWLPMPVPSQLIGDTPTFLDASTGWLVGLSVDPTTRVTAFDRLYVTHDGGQTWHPITPNREVQFVGFVTTQVGWAINNPTNGGPPQLLSTLDGGSTWQLLRPVVDRVTQSEHV